MDLVQFLKYWDAASLKENYNCSTLINRINKIIKKIYLSQSFVVLIILIGTAARMRQYLFNKTTWQILLDFDKLVIEWDGTSRRLWQNIRFGRQIVTALTTKLELWRIRWLARRANSLQLSPALTAELVVFRILESALAAFHGLPLKGQQENRLVVRNPGVNGDWVAKWKKRDWDGAWCLGSV